MTGQTVLTETPSEWILASEIQQRFMQRSRPTTEGLDYNARCRQMHAVGGDFYHFAPLTDGRLAMAVGDASGKGLPAALMISNVQSSLRTATLFAGDDGPVVVEAVNRQVYETSLTERFATLFYGVFDRQRRILRYVNAGHNPPMIMRRDGSTVWLEAGGPPIGVFPDWTYEECVVELNPGDMILAYTDGIVEAMNSKGEEWGVEGLRKAVAECQAHCAGDLVRAVFAGLDEYTDGLQMDDATLAVLRVS